MLITTVISLAKEEIESFLNMKTSFNYEEYEGTISACVDGFIDNETEKYVGTDDAMELLLKVLKDKALVPKEVEDFSFEIPSCGVTKQSDDDIEDIAVEFVISYATTK